MLATTYLAFFAAIAAPAFAGVAARGQDSSNFNRDTAPQGYESAPPVYQISDGQPQNNPPATPVPAPTSAPVYETPVAPPVYETSAPVVVPTVEVPPVVTSVGSVEVPVPTPEVPVTPVPLPTPIPSNGSVPSASVIFPNSTLATSAGTAPAASATGTAPPTSNGATALNALGSIGLVAVVAGLLL